MLDLGSCGSNKECGAYEDDDDVEAYYYMGIVRNSEYRYSTDGGSVDV